MIWYAIIVPKVCDVLIFLNFEACVQPVYAMAKASYNRAVLFWRHFGAFPPGSTWIPLDSLPLCVCLEIKGCKKGVWGQWGARITQSDPHSGSSQSVGSEGEGDP